MPFMAPIICFFYETDLHFLMLHIMKKDGSDTPIIVAVFVS